MLLFSDIGVGSSFLDFELRRTILIFIFSKEQFCMVFHHSTLYSARFRISIGLSAIRDPTLCSTAVFGQSYPETARQ